MIVATVTVEGISPLIFGMQVSEAKRQQEDYDSFEDRTWRMRAPKDSNGETYLSGYSWTKTIQQAARFRGEKFKGQKTFGQIFAAGIMVVDDTPIGVKWESLERHKVFVPSNGKKATKGGGGRVWRSFPMARKWKCTFDVQVLHEAITADVLRRHLDDAGMFCGQGTWRPDVGGFYGRFVIKSIRYNKEA